MDGAERNEIGKRLRDAVARRRGWADFFDWPEKDTKEGGIARTFMEELERDNGPAIAGGCHHPAGANHAPDFRIDTKSGERWGVEITELVDRKSIEMAKRRREHFEPWTDETLVSRFEAIVARKDHPASLPGGEYDRYVLLVHVDEDMLPADRIRQVFGERILRTDLIDDVYVLVSYDPASNRCPLVKLAVSRNPRPG